MCWSSSGREKTYPDRPHGLKAARAGRLLHRDRRNIAGINCPATRACSAILRTRSCCMRYERAGESSRRTVQRTIRCAHLSIGDMSSRNHALSKFAGIIKMQVDGFEKDYKHKLCRDGHAVRSATLRPCVKSYGRGREARQALKDGGNGGVNPQPRTKRCERTLAKKLIALCRRAPAPAGHAFAGRRGGSARVRGKNFGYRGDGRSATLRRELKRTWSHSVPMNELLCREHQQRPKVCARGDEEGACSRRQPGGDTWRRRRGAC